MAESRLRIAFFAALREELRAIWPQIRRAEVVRAEGFQYHRGIAGKTEIVVVRTGIGPTSAAARSAVVLDREKPGFCLVTGFAGALRAGLSTGDIVVASEVCMGLDPASERVGGGEGGALSWAPPPGLLSAALNASRGETLASCPGVRAGRVVTVSRVASTAREKRELGERHDADAVDMESGAVAQAASDRGIPFLCARAILDDVDLDLSFDFGAILTPEGKPRPLKLLGAVARHPRRIVDVVGLGARVRRATGSLRVYLPALVGSLTEVLGG